MHPSNIIWVGDHPIPTSVKARKLTCAHILPKSRDHSTSEYFGPGIWYSLHDMAEGADDGTISKRTFIEYANRLRTRFPCKECREHYNQYLKENPLPRSGFYEWTVTFHNRVNRRLSHKYNLKKCTMSIDEARQHFDGIRAGLKSDGSKCTSCD